MITDTQLKTLARMIVDEQLARAAAAFPGVLGPTVPRRLTVIEFGVCVALSPGVVKKRIRSRFIAQKFVEGVPGGLYRIDRAALEKFNVTPEVAAERLQAWQVRQQPVPMPVQTPPQSAQPSAA